MSTQQEFEKALEMLNTCIANLKCGVSLTSDAGLFADSIYYRCEEYRKIYIETKHGK